MNVLSTGRLGIGKTTLIKKVIDMTSLSKGGFYTEEIREAGQRVGFSLTTLDVFSEDNLILAVLVSES